MLPRFSQYLSDSDRVLWDVRRGSHDGGQVVVLSPRQRRKKKERTSEWLTPSPHPAPLTLHDFFGAK